MNEIPESDDIVLLTYAELASILKVNKKTASSLVESGQIPLVEISPRIHRVRLSDVKRFIATGGVRSNV